MLKQSLLAIATTGFVAAASVMAASPAAASSSPSFSLAVYGPNYGFVFGHPHFVPRPQYVCTPTYKRVTYKYKGKTYSRLVQTGQTCRWVYPSPPKHGPYPYQYRPYSAG